MGVGRERGEGILTTYIPVDGWVGGWGVDCLSMRVFVSPLVTFPLCLSVCLFQRRGAVSCCKYIPGWMSRRVYKGVSDGGLRV